MIAYLFLHQDFNFSLVNRAARVAAQCEHGQVCVGVPMDSDEEPPDPGPTVEVEILGVKLLKGITTEMAIFSCRKKVDGISPSSKASDKKDERKSSRKSP